MSGVKGYMLAVAALSSPDMLGTWAQGRVVCEHPLWGSADKS